jgi:MFS family permease
MSLAFLFVFLAYGGVQQYVITYFNGLNRSHVGFVSLILIYATNSICSPLAAAGVARFGAKRAMLASLPFYSLFILSLVTRSTPTIWVASITLGVAASVLWNGQNTCLVRAAYDDALGRSAGFFALFNAAGTGIGVVIVGLAIVRTSYTATFLVAAVVPVLGAICIAQMNDIGAPDVSRRVRALSAARSKTAWRISVIWFSGSFVFGLALSVIPLVIHASLGLAYVGILTSCFYVVPILASYTVGNQSDIRGRKTLLYVAGICGAAGLIALTFSNVGGAVVVIGVVLVAVSNSMGAPITTALVGDVATELNLASIVSLFRMMQGAGIVAGLVVAAVLRGTTALEISLGSLIVCFAVFLPVFREDIPEIRSRIAREIG